MRNFILGLFCGLSLVATPFLIAREVYFDKTPTEGILLQINSKWISVTSK